MKKFCSLFLSAVATAALLTSCGGGGGNSDPQRMTLKDFANGTKYINLTTYNINYNITPIAAFDTSGRLPEDEAGASITVRGQMFNRYDVVFTYTVLSATEFQVSFGWSYDGADQVIVDGTVAAAFGVEADIYEGGTGYRANLGGLSSTFTFDQTSKTATLESHWGSTAIHPVDPVAVQVPYTVVVK